MSVCDPCLAYSLRRAGAITDLELGELPLASARELLESQLVEASTPGLDLAVAACREQLDALDVWAICQHDPRYPFGLTGFRRDADIPRVIFGRGSADFLDDLRNSASVAIVGARRATAYGREVAYSMAHELAEAGVAIVSGMALGIDGAAHRGALQGRGGTLAVLAGGPDRPYPRSHRLLYEQILERGCVISESPPGVEAQRWGFVARNRIIAAIAEMTLLVEGTQNTGARHTVSFADELDRMIGAVPGPVTSPASAAPNALLKLEGVLPVCSAEDVLAALGVERFRQPQAALEGFDEASDSARVVAQIAAGARSPRALSAALPELAQREISQLLGELELAGKVRRGAGGQYELVDGWR